MTASSALQLAAGPARLIAAADAAAQVATRFLNNHPMRGVTLAFITVGMISTACAATPQRPKGANCRLDAPPRSAGEINAPREIAFVYPRTKDIGMGYLGCQTVWVRGEHGAWDIVTLVRIERRSIVEVWPPPPDDESPEHCAYSHGRILPNGPAVCRALQTLSFPAGCLARSFRMHIYSAMPKGCEEG